MRCRGQNHPFVLWAACFLWLTSIFSITWSLLLFFCVGDILWITNTDLVTAFLLLSGIIMLPTNVHMLYSIANGKKIDHKAKVVCCPLWLCIVWIIIVDVAAAILCIHRIYFCQESTSKYMAASLKNYRSVPKYKRFMDNLQWSLKCCGFHSFKDWFDHDWYDQMKDYEWDPSINIRNRKGLVTDSVPLSCCKSGSCISNYLMELGTYSINTDGCGDHIHQIIMISMVVYLVMFLLTIIIECNKNTEVRHIMSAKDKFDVSSGSCLLDSEQTDDEEALREVDPENLKMDTYNK
ncbi:uncharacterized protein ACR2FA_003595 [Aphomia sociella]